MPFLGLHANKGHRTNKVTKPSAGGHDKLLLAPSIRQRHLEDIFSLRGTTAGFVIPGVLARRYSIAIKAHHLFIYGISPLPPPSISSLISLFSISNICFLLAPHCRETKYSLLIALASCTIVTTTQLKTHPFPRAPYRVYRAQKSCSRPGNASCDQVTYNVTLDNFRLMTVGKMTSHLNYSLYLMSLYTRKYICSVNHWRSMPTPKRLGRSCVWGTVKAYHVMKGWRWENSIEIYK